MKPRRMLLTVAVSLALLGGGFALAQTAAPQAPSSAPDAAQPHDGAAPGMPGMGMGPPTGAGPGMPMGPMGVGPGMGPGPGMPMGPMMGMAPGMAPAMPMGPMMGMAPGMGMGVGPGMGMGPMMGMVPGMPMGPMMGMAPGMAPAMPMGPMMGPGPGMPMGPMMGTGMGPGMGMPGGWMGMHHHGHGLGEDAQDRRFGSDDTVEAAFEAINRRMHRQMMAPTTGNPDADFAQAMITHYRGAVDMAKLAVAFGDDPEIRKLAESVIAAQSAEIRVLEDWLRRREP